MLPITYTPAPGKAFENFHPFSILNRDFVKIHGGAKDLLSNTTRSSSIVSDHSIVILRVLN
jgi:hypothetical protein